MYEDSNLKTDCQISEDWKNRLSCNHYIKCFCFNHNVANKNTNTVDESSDEVLSTTTHRKAGLVQKEGTFTL
jgi:hypothetical protein